MSVCEAHLVNTLCGCKRVWLAPEVLDISPHFFPPWTASFDQIHQQTTGQNSLPTMESQHVSKQCFIFVYVRFNKSGTFLTKCSTFSFPLAPEQAASLSHFGRMEEKLISLNLVHFLSLTTTGLSNLLLYTTNTFFSVLLTLICSHSDLLYDRRGD